MAVPEWAWGECFRLYALGYGCLRVAEELDGMGITAAKSSVHRLLTGKGVYKGRRVRPRGQRGVERVDKG